MPKRQGAEQQTAQIVQQQIPLEGASVTRAAKNQANQAKAVAAKLERFARTTLSPVKSQQLAQVGVSGIRKSQGSAQASAPAEKMAAINTKRGDTKGAEKSSTVMNRINPIGPPNPGEENMEASSPGNDGEPTMKDLLLAINACKDTVTGMDQQLKSIKEELGLMGGRLKETEKRTTSLEERVSAAEDILFPLRQEVLGLKKQIDAQAAKIDELENRNRRCNVRIIGMPERSEGADPVAFLEGWLREEFGAASFSPFFCIERAHRVPIKPRQESGYPRPMIMKMLNYSAI